MVREIQRLSSLGVHLANSEDSGVSIREVAESSIIDEVKRHQYEDPILAQYRDATLQKEKTPFKVTPDGVLRYEGRLCVPDTAGLRRKLWERHTLPVILFTQGQQNCIMTSDAYIGGMA